MDIKPPRPGNLTNGDHAPKVIRRNFLPDSIDIPSAWTGDDLKQSPERWRWRLSEKETECLKDAAENALKQGIRPAEITKKEFALPTTLQSKLRTLRKTLIHGIGFEVIRGIPVDELSEESVSAIFFGIGTHLGRARPQNASGDLLGHVRDSGADSKDPNTRIYQTNERQTFHTDSCDAVGLLCLKEAREGGESMLVSAVTIYNEMRRRRPDLLQFLFDPIATDRRGEVSKGEQPFFRIPVYSMHEGMLTVMYQRQYIDSAQRFAEAPVLTPEHIEALDLFDKLANDPRLHLRMRLLPGDMQFVYNHSLLHDRTSFVDHPEHDRKRHLLRLWLSLPEDRPLPWFFSERYGSVEIGNRGGVIV